MIPAPVAALNISKARCAVLAMPEDPKLTLPGFAFEYATSSLTVWTGRLRVTVIVIGVRTSKPTSAKSRCGS